MTLDRAGLAAGLATVAVWGLAGVFIRLIDDTPAPAVAAGRLAVACLVLAPFLIARPGAARAAFLSPAPPAMGAYYVMSTEAFTRAPVAEVLLLIAAAPAAALLINAARGRRPDRLQIRLVGLGLVGLALYLGPRMSLDGLSVGHGLAAACAFASALYAAGLRAGALAGRGQSPIATTAAACFWGLLLSLAIAPDGAVASLWRPEDSGLTLSLIATLGLLCTALPTFTYGVAAARLPTVLATSAVLAAPLFGGLAAGVFLGEWPLLSSLPGAALALAALFLLLRAGEKRRAPSSL